MKLIITASGEGLESEVDTRFGRAKNFMVIDTETEKWEMIDNNQNLNAAQGAGIQAAQNVVDAGAEVVITGNCGPKAFSVLKTADVDVYVCESGTVKDMLEKFREGKLEKAENANVEGHW